MIGVGWRLLLDDHDDSPIILYVTAIGGVFLGVNIIVWKVTGSSETARTFGVVAAWLVALLPLLIALANPDEGVGGGSRFEEAKGGWGEYEIGSTKTLERPNGAMSSLLFHLSRCLSECILSLALGLVHH
jgi:ABC-type cobalt transport system substrate-binding protein